MNVIKPPTRLLGMRDKFSIFLGGSIEMGKASEWQKEIEDALYLYDVDIFNPRRDNWDSSWEQDISNPYFKEQVVWELDHLELADLIVLYFDPNTKSPISLLELGLFKDKKCIICCPKGFWRRGNVQIVCERYGILFVESLEQLIIEIQGIINE